MNDTWHDTTSPNTPLWNWRKKHEHTAHSLLIAFAGTHSLPKHTETVIFSVHDDDDNNDNGSQFLTQQTPRRLLILHQPFFFLFFFSTLRRLRRQFHQKPHHHFLHRKPPRRQFPLRRRRRCRRRTVRILTPRFPPEPARRHRWVLSAPCLPLLQEPENVACKNRSLRVWSLA